MFVLPTRSLVRITGEAARGFLNNLVTNNVAQLVPGTSAYAALLTPQGKILGDFLVYGQHEGLDLDVALERAKIIVATLNRYKLRAKLTISLCKDLVIIAQNANEQAAFRDPRHSDLPMRIVLPEEQAPPPDPKKIKHLQDLEIMRCIPQGGHDFLYDDAFPAEANMDRLHGIDFHKGCYVGQEVVSRMYHSAVHRSRIVKVAIKEPIAEGTSILDINHRPIARMGRSNHTAGFGLALARLDRLQEVNHRGYSEGNEIVFIENSQ